MFRYIFLSVYLISSFSFSQTPQYLAANDTWFGESVEKGFVKIGTRDGNSSNTHSFEKVKVSNSGAEAIKNANAVTRKLAGATFTSVSDGTWSTAAIWDCGAVPTVGSTVIINHEVTLPNSAVSVANLTINEAGELITVNNRLLTITGNLTIDGILNSREASTPQENISMTGNGAILDGTGMIESTAGLSNNNGYIFGFDNNITIASTANITFDQNDADNPDFVRIGSGFTVTNNGTVTINRSIFGEDGTSTWTNASNAVVNIGNDFMSTGIINVSSSGNTVSYNGTGAQTITAPSGNQYFDLLIAGTDTKTLAANTEVLGDLTISSTLDPDGNDITLNGNWINNGAYLEGSETVIFNTSTDQSVTAATSEVFNNLTLSKSGAQWISNTSVQVTGTLSITDVFVNIGANTMTLGSSTAATGTLLTSGTVSIIGNFKRWVNSGNQTNLIFPVGTATTNNQIEVDFNTLTSEGTLTGTFISEAPEPISSAPLNDAGVDINNVYIEGYWSLSAGNSLSSNDYDLSLTGNGFTSFTPTNDTRLLVRSNSSSDWGLSGDHVASSFVSPNVRRSAISQLSAQYTFAENDNCSLPNTSTITGPNEVCINDAGDSYSVTGTIGSTFTWSVVGGTIQGANTGVDLTSITVDWGSTGQTGEVQVIEDNSAVGGCGSGAPVTLGIAINPLSTSDISGISTTTVSTTGTSFTVEPNTGYTYDWSLSPVSDHTLIEDGSASASVDWGTTVETVTVSVTATNTVCGESAAPVTLDVSVNDIIESAGTGTWSTGSVWVGGVVPTSTDNVRINAGHTVTLPNSPVTIQSLEIETGAELITVNNQLLTIEANLTVDGTLNSRETSTPEPNIAMTGDGAILGGSGTIEFTNGLSNDNNHIFAFESNVSIAASANLTFDQQDPDNPNFIRIASNSIVTNNGTVTINRNIFGENANSTWINAQGSTLNIGGELLSTGVVSATSPENLINYNGSAAQSVKSTFNNIYYDLSISGNDVKSLSSSIIVSNDLSISSIFEANSFDIELAGNWANTGSFEKGTGSVIFNGTGNQTITSTVAESFHDLTITKAGATLSINSDTEVSNTLTLNNSFVNMNSFTLTLGTGLSELGSLALTEPVSIVGKFERWVNTSNQTGLIFPVGTSDQIKPLSISFLNLTPGSLIAEFISSNPGSFASTPQDDDGFDLNNLYTTGYWTLSRDNALASSNYDISLTANDFSPFTLSSDSRIVTRANANSDWLVNGNHVSTGFVSPTVSRSGMSILSAEYTIAENDNCSLPATSAITGNTSVCASDAGEIYTVTNTANSTYTWEVTGGSIITGQGTNSITVDWSSVGQNANITVTEDNSAAGGCGVGVPVELLIDINPIPATNLSGASSVGINQTGTVYTVDNQTGYTYAWSISPANDHVFNPASPTTNTATVDWGNTSGSVVLSVTATNTLCAQSASPTTLTIEVLDEIVSAQTGSWNTASTWVGGVVPASTSNVRIASGHEVTLPNSEVNVQNLTIDQGAELNTVNNQLLTIENNLTVNGILDSREASTPEANISMTGSGGILDGTGTIEFTAEVNNNNSYIFSFDNNITIAATADLTFDQQDSDNPDFLRIANNSIVTNNGTVTINENIFGQNADARWINNTGATLNIEGELLSVGTLDATSEGNTINYSGIGSQSIKAPLSDLYYNLTLSGSNSKTLSANTIVQNDIVISSIFDANGFNLSVGGNWSNTGIFNEGTQSVSFNGTGTQSITSSSAETFYDLSVDKAAESLSMDVDVIISNQLSLNTGNVVTPNELTIGTGTGNLGSLVHVSPASIEGSLTRWVAASNQSSVLFPIGTTTSQPITLSFNTLTSEGTVTCSFIESDPGANGLDLTDGSETVRNQFTQGYWTLSRDNGLATTDYDVSIATDGFDDNPFAISTGRVLLRTSSSNPWIVEGNHVAASGTTIGRNNLTSLSAEISIGTTTNCEPSNTSSITGETNVCLNESAVNYMAIGGLSGSTYTWTVDGGSIVSGQGTSSIVVDWGSTGGTGTVSVIENNNFDPFFGCGDGSEIELSVDINPLSTSVISGSSILGVGNTGISYSVEDNGYAYTWSLPEGGTIVSGQGTSTILIDWDNTPGNYTISVDATESNACSPSEIAPTVMLDVNLLEVIESAQTGNWNATSTWVNNIIPTSNDNVRINSSHVVTATTNSTTTDLNIESGAELIVNNNILLTIEGNFTLNGTLTSLEASTPQEGITMMGNGAILDGSGTIQFTAALNNNNSHIFNFGNNTTIASTANITFDQQDSDNPDFIRIASNRIVTNLGNVTINRNIIGESSSSTWINDDNSSLSIEGELIVTGILDASGDNNSVTYSGNGTQTVKSPSSSYANLLLSGSNNKTLEANTIVDENLTISGTFDLNGFDITVGGNWTNSGVFIPGANSVTFSASTDQSITNAIGETFYDVVVSKPSSTLLLANDVTVSNQLTMSEGNINTGSNRLSLGTSATNEGTLTYTSGSIIGEFERWVNSLSSFDFPVGTALDTRNFTIDYSNESSVTQGGSVTLTFLEESPGTAGLPLTDGVYTVRNTFSEGFWRLSYPNTVSIGTPEIRLTANGFSSFTIDSDTRVVSRQSSSSNWIAEGDHENVVGAVAGRNNIGNTVTEFTLGDETVCNTPVTSAITRTNAGSNCINDTGVLYGVANTVGSVYTWTVEGGTIAGGQGDNEISVTWGNTGGTFSLSVTEDNSGVSGGCGTGTPVNLEVEVNPIPTSDIEGLKSVPEGSTSVTYSVTNTTGYTYAWTVANGTLVSGDGTNTITVDWPSIATGTVSVIATNTDCGESAPETSLSVDVFEVIESIQTGNWNVATTWETGSVPQSGNSVRIASGHTVTLTNDQEINNISVQSGATLQINNNNDLDINGDLTLDGIIDSREASAPQINLSFQGAGSTISGTGSFVVGNANLNNNNSPVLSFSANLTIAAGSDLTFTQNDGDNPDFLRIDSDRTITNNGSITIVGGSLIGENANSKWINAAGSTVNISNSLLSTGMLNASQSNNTVNYDRSGDQDINIPEDNQYYNLTIDGSGIKSQQADIEVLGDLNIIAGTMNGGGFDIDISGNWTNNGDYTEAGSEVAFNGTVDQTISNASSEVFNNLTINKSSGTVILSNNTDVTGVLQLLRGNVITGANTLTLGDNSISTGTLDYTAGQVVGNFQRWIRDDSDGVDFLYPLGDGTTYYPLVLTTPTITTGGTAIASFNASDIGSTGLPTGDDGAGTMVENAFSEGFWTLSSANGFSPASYNLDATGTDFSSFTLDANTRLISRLSGNNWPSNPSTPSGTHAAAIGNQVMRDGISLLLTTGIEIAVGDITDCPVINTSSISGDAEGCINTSDTYSVTGDASNDFTWTLSGGGTFNENGLTTYTATGDTDITVDWGADGGDFVLTVFESSGCTIGTSQALSITVNPVGETDFIVSGNTNVQTGAVGEIYSIVNRSGYDYLWSTADGTIVGSNTSSSVSVDWTGTGTGALDLDITFADPFDLCPDPNPTIPTVQTNITFFDEFIFTGTGSFDLASNWNCNCVPDLNSDVTITGDVSLSDNSIVVADLIVDGSLDNNGFEITVNRNYELNGTHTGTGETLLRGNNSTINGSGVKNSGDLSFLDGDKSIVSGANLTLGGTLTLGSGVELTNNGTLTLNGTLTGDNNTSSTLNNAANANLTINTTDFLSTGRIVANAANNVVTYAGALDQNIKSPAGSPSGYYDLTLNGTGNKSLSNNTLISNDLSLLGATFLGGTFTTSLSGDWLQNGGSFTPETSTIQFNGSSAQQIQSSGGATTFYNLEINNSGTGNAVSLASNVDITVTNELILTDGLILTSANEQLILDAASVSGSFEASNPISYVNGPLIHRVSGTNPADLIFPIGTGSFHKLQISNIVQDGASADFTAEFIDGNVNSLTVSDNTTYGTTTADLLDGGLSNVGYWERSRTAADGFTSADLSLFYTGDDGIEDFENLTIAHANDVNDVSGWTNLLPTGFGGSQTIEGSVTAGITSFSIDALANNGTGTNSLLPVDLLYFKGKAEDNQVLLSWATASEENNDFFEIEHSLDGISFEYIGWKEGNGNSNRLIEYDFIDEYPSPGINYYRLKQVDFDGEENYHPIIAVTNDFIKSGIDVSVYPNPTTPDNINLRVVSGDDHTAVQVRIVDIQGRSYFKKRFKGALNFDEKIRTKRQMPSGLYFLLINQGGNVSQKKIVISR